MESRDLQGVVDAGVAADRIASDAEHRLLRAGGGGAGIDAAALELLAQQAHQARAQANARLREAVALADSLAPGRRA